MPPVVGIAIAVAAAVTEAVPVIATAVAGAADAIGATSVLAGVVGEGAAGAIVGDVSLGVGGAVVGAASGAATAAAAGGSPLKGALYGAATGGLTQGLTPEVQGILPDGTSAAAAQSITSGVVQTGAKLVQGKPLGTALAQGAASGASQYAAGSAVNALSDMATPGNLQPMTSDQSMTDPTSTTFDPSQPFPAGSVAATGGATPSTPAPADTTAPETVVSSATPAGTGGVSESVTVTGTKPKATSASPQLDLGNLIGEAQQQPGVKTAEKAGISTALMSLLFPGGGGQYQPTAGGLVSGTPGSTPGAMSPAQVAALIGQSGQPGGSSTMAPGGPLFGAPAGGRTGAWNQASLRTDQAGGTS